MRSAFVRELTALAANDPNTILITGDLGFGVLTDYARQFPRQYINAGVAEQNMTALAVGLALEGKTVFTYSIANFPTLRCLEQIRNDACYHRANVKIVSVGGGFAYGALGISHHATEDLAIMRALPNLAVFSPGDPKEVEWAARMAHRTPGTCYLRLGKGGEPVVHAGHIEPALGATITIHPGGEIAILSTGGILPVAAAAQVGLCERGIPTALHSVPTLKPFPHEEITKLARQHRLIVTIEEHSANGGLGGSVAEVLAEMGDCRARLLRCGLQDKFFSAVGTQDYLRAEAGLTADAVVDRTLKIWREFSDS